ncbi:MAG: hypothetical protein HQ483_16085 [Rhodospirillales bacterium]|nr:hypothetical protein [Rhodospirillales bacterium]
MVTFFLIIVKIGYLVVIEIILSTVVGLGFISSKIVRLSINKNMAFMFSLLLVGFAVVILASLANDTMVLFQGTPWVLYGNKTPTVTETPINALYELTLIGYLVVVFLFSKARIMGSDNRVRYTLFAFSLSVLPMLINRAWIKLSIYPIVSDVLSLFS